MRFQLYPKWHFGHDKILATLGDHSWYDHYVFLGPLQIGWSGKPWVSHLRRSPEFVTELRKVLLKDLNAKVYTHTDP